MDLNRANVVVVVFVMEGCPACTEYLPRFQRVAALYHAHFPIYVLDAAADDAEIQRLADRTKVKATPTTLVMQRGPGVYKTEGAVDDADIQGILQSAYQLQYSPRQSRYA